MERLVVGLMDDSKNSSQDLTPPTGELVKRIQQYTYYVITGLELVRVMELVTNLFPSNIFM